MTCTSFTIPASPTSSTSRTIDIVKEKNRIRRSYSDNHMCYSFDHIQAKSTQPNNGRSIGISSFQTSNPMIRVEKNMNVGEITSDQRREIKRANWVERLMQIRTNWNIGQQRKVACEDNVCYECENDDYESGEEGDCTKGCSLEELDGEMRYKSYDAESFSRFLVRAPWSDTKQFSQLAFLCNLAYVLPQIKAQAKDLKRYYGLRLVTSSLEKKAEADEIREKLDKDSTRVPVADGESTESDQKRSCHPSVAYNIAASAASYVRSREDSLILGSKSQQEGDGNNSREGGSSPRSYKPEVAVSMAASTMTVMVTAGEREKQETAQDLQSLHSSPCEWFVCDDSSTYTRYFVIQGSDSLASWQANLFFEPTKFEGTDVLAHRGIYEAAKGMYEQFMPEIIDHLNRHGEQAKLQFTGHSLGGSLSLFVHLMLLSRKLVKPSTLLPVVTFGSPFVFCGGQKILDQLGMEESQIHSVMMHRDIVPRAFSCNYPNHVATLLKRINGSFRSHPCLIKNKMLYSPMGKLFILQPDEKSSPPHPLLPPGSALYALDKTQSGFSSSVLRTFLNSPHPLETLSDPTAYGSEGTILRDHDSSNYLKAVNEVLRQNTRMVIRNVRKERNLLWPLLNSPSPHSWNHESNLESSGLATKEILTGV